MADRVDETTLELLRAARIEGLNVRLHRVEQDEFKKYHQAMGRLGGKWKGGRTQAHVFTSDPGPAIEMVVATGELPKRNALQFFPTPRDLVAEMVAWAELEDLAEDALFLDACAGRGAIADGVMEVAGDRVRDRITLVELDPLNAALLRRKGYANVIEGDFLAYRPARKYKRILMNPPFNLDGDPNTYVEMILHAWELLDEDGILVAIAGPGFVSGMDARSKRLISLVDERGHRHWIEKGAFRESGTDASTVMIVLERERESCRLRAERQPHDGYQNYYAFKLDMHRMCSETYYEEMQAVFARIYEGELPLNLLGEPVGEAVRVLREMYERILSRARDDGEHIPMREEWLTALVNWLVTEHYPEYQYYRSRPVGEMAAA